MFNPERRTQFLLVIVGLLVVVPTNAEVQYNRDVRPVLSDRCFQCHGPDSGKRKAGLRLDVASDAYANLAAPDEAPRRAIVPGEPQQSELLKRVYSHDPDKLMPPPESKIALTEPQKQILHQWIAEGAEYQPHWSFIPLKPVAVPKELAADAWCRNDVDRLVLAKLRETPGLNPAPEASREVLVRRLYFDLTGLPPTPEEVDRFLNEKSPLAYEELVEELLKSPRYGERMATDWLDVARYADSYGYQVDRDRTVWRWRDWVINAFNNNKPYDQFITEQLAGDLLPNPTDEQVLATTFNRLHQQKVEGGSVPEEFRVEYVADRTHTFGTAFLGLTLECSRCHDHKFDPVTQKEYYQLTAFFANIDEAGLYSYFTDSIPTPVLAIRNGAAKEKAAALEAAVAGEERALEQIKTEQRDAFEQWKQALTADEPVVEGELARFEFEDATNGHLANLAREDQPAKTPAANVLIEGRPGRGNAIQLTGDDAVTLPVGNFPRHQPFSVSLWMWAPDKVEREVVFHRSRAWTDSASRGYELLIEDGRLSGALIHYWPGNALRVQATDELPLQQWVHVTFAWDGSSRAEGLTLYVDGRPAQVEIVRDNLYKNITGSGGDNITIGERFRDRGFKGGRIDDFRVFDRELTALEVAQLYQPKPVPSIAKADDRLAYDYYLAKHNEPYRAQLAKLQEARKARNQDQDSVEEIMAMREKAGAPFAYVLQRGHYEGRSEKVGAATPAFLPPMSPGAPGNRLGLAQWLTDRSNPLTARVTVNRYWQMLFGRGLVGTTEDFGSQGELPVFKNLLDWLALNFIDSGWDTKELLRTIVTSSTYRQQSFVPGEIMTSDPENRLLARGPRYRLPAEMIRDNALAASGLLVEQMGGPPVKPYDVAESFTPSSPDSGDKLYRRSVYTYWKMSGAAPVMIALDAAKRDVCTVRRERTSSPLQSLVLLNDPQMTEAGRKLAENCMKKHGDKIDATIDEMFLRLTSKRPDARQVAVLRCLYSEQLAYFTANPASAEQFLKTGESPRDQSLAVPELAATAVLAKALLNYDECVTKR
ncbi:MAG: DUF1553 domain-containing protein [Verrucomicrobiae bacterium]|nr:DUF1553 domain-containing protein [Verrucomicrobiae bacterium]